MLKGTFLGYLDEWEASVMSREDFSPAQRKTMLRDTIGPQNDKYQL